MRTERPAPLSEVTRRSLRSGSLPVFPWDTLAEVTAAARAYPDGIVDLSVGTPVDEVAAVIREALAAASSSPGYPTTAGTQALREAMVAALHRRYGITGLTPAAVLPVIGTKELIAWLPTLLDLGPADTVVVPRLCHPAVAQPSRWWALPPVCAIPSAASRASRPTCHPTCQLAAANADVGVAVMSAVARPCHPFRGVPRLSSHLPPHLPAGGR